MNASINICYRNRGYAPVPSQPVADPRSNQGQPLRGMGPMSGNQPYQGGPPPAANQYNQQLYSAPPAANQYNQQLYSAPPTANQFYQYQPPPMNQQAGRFQVI